MSQDHRALGRPPVIGERGVPVFLREIVAELPAGSRVLDAGCGPGSWDYGVRDDLRIVGFDVLDIRPTRPWPRGASFFRGDLARLPLRDRSFDAVIVHYTLEHVTSLIPSVDECARVVAPQGLVYVSVPRASAFDDRFYRFAGYFAKYAMLKLRKRIEHQQRFDFASLVGLFYERGFVLEGFAAVPAGFSWMNDPRTKRWQAPFIGVLGTIKRLTGIDLFREANYVCRFRHTGRMGLRRVTHVCRDCGEQSIVAPPDDAPSSWICPFCGRENGLYLAPGEGRRLRALAEDDRERR